MASTIVLCLLISVLVGLNVWATRAVILDPFPSPKQRLAQIVVIWGVPIVGPLLALYLCRETDRSARGYREPPEPGDDFGHSHLIHRQMRQAFERETDNHGMNLSND